jgi:hypothetical protein
MYFFNFFFHRNSERTPPISKKLDEWWQLFDTKTKRFYYYNLYDQKTSWHKPAGAKSASILNMSDSFDPSTDPIPIEDSTIVNLLASKILNILVNNYSLDKKLDVLLDDVEFDKKISNLSIDLDALFKQEEIISLIAEARSQQRLLNQTVASSTLNRNRTVLAPSRTTPNELKKSISMVSSSSSTASLKHDQAGKGRPAQPRTNPNYKNVRTGASQQASTNMSEEESGVNNSSLSDFRKYFVKTNTKLSGFHSLSSLNNSYFSDLTQATVMLIRLLNKVANENLMINKENHNNNNNISASSISWSTESPNSTSLSDSRNNNAYNGSKYCSNTDSRSNFRYFESFIL